MEIKKVAIALGIDNDKCSLEWRVKIDYGTGFVEVTKNSTELKTMLNQVVSNIVEFKEKTVYGN